jgi:hypothetical protein
MGQVPTTSTRNNERYTQVKVSIRPDLALAFKTACAANNCSLTDVISDFMAKYSKVNTPKNGYAPNLSTKRKRRAVVRHILEQLVWIRENEENYVNNIPENLHSSEMFIFAEYCVGLINEALEALDTAYHIGWTG